MKPLQHKRLIEKELEGFGIRLNKQPPNIVFKKKDKGGLNLTCLVRISSLFSIFSLFSFSFIFFTFYSHNRNKNFIRVFTHKIIIVIA
ncbi:unnamed protein product [Anisakis simplex]|uniref:Developmentally-regulated GTP-binding protein 1 (inferred by orthology to a human protein) n=1 Tax=Anisakis simplex TaxID=6269 RepID=A0A0M3KIG4_ANISI|nr:unnamed protein product [Anisakis simplex]